MRRVRPRASRVLFVLSLAVAGLATAALRSHLTRLEAAAGAGGPAGPVVVAARELGRGTVVEAAMLEVRTVPDRWRPPGALASPDEAVGRVLAADVGAGEAITVSRLAPPGGPVATLVPAGLRAVPLTAPMPEGALVPGDRVDVLATYVAGQPHSETVVSGAEVLKVLPASGLEDVGAATTVLILVGPETAERLAYARSLADLSLAIGPAAEAAA